MHISVSMRMCEECSWKARERVCVQMGHQESTPHYCYCGQDAAVSQLL